MRAAIQVGLVLGVFDTAISEEDGDPLSDRDHVITDRRTTRDRAIEIEENRHLITVLWI